MRRATSEIINVFAAVAEPVVGLAAEAVSDQPLIAVQCSPLDKTDRSRCLARWSRRFSACVPRCEPSEHGILDSRFETSIRFIA